MLFFVLFFCLNTFFVFGKNLDTYFFLIKQLQFEEAKAELINWNDPKEKQLLEYLADLMYYAGQQPLNEIQVTPENNYEEVLVYLTQGYRQLYYTPNKSEAFKNFHASFEIAKKIKYEPLIKATLIAIFEYYQSEILQNSQQFEIYLSEFGKLKLDETDAIITDLFSLIFLSQILDKPGSKYFELADRLSLYLKEIDEDSRLVPRIYYEKALSLEINDSLDSASNFYQLAFEATKNYPFLQYMRFSAKIKLSDIAFRKKKYQKALTLVNDAKKYFNRSDSIRSNLYIYRYSARYYAGLKKYDSAYINFKRSTDAEYRLDFRKNSLEISRLNVVLRTQQKELENNKLRQNRIWLIVALSLVGLLLLLSYLAYKNIGAKKRIVENESEIQTQKIENLLKEQELLGLDAMIEGQEKERQRIANDLHDNLGSLLATVKHHVQNLKLNKARTKGEQKGLLEKTDDLIEEAYQKVRHLAHARNAGVHAQQGLLPAIKSFAAKVSVANELVINVKDHGLDHRLENSLEITLFRIIQELITNIIKHSGAAEATIHLTHHADSINILVEDHGKGFKVSEIKPGNGMGLYSIQKRVENLKGTLTIESLKDKGTTVIIDIPLV